MVRKMFDTFPLSSFGRYVTANRGTYHISIISFAKAVGIDEKRMKDIEDGAIPTTDEIQVIMKYFGCDEVRLATERKRKMRV